MNTLPKDFHAVAQSLLVATISLLLPITVWWVLIGIVTALEEESSPEIILTLSIPLFSFSLCVYFFQWPEFRREMEIGPSLLIDMGTLFSALGLMLFWIILMLHTYL